MTIRQTVACSEQPLASSQVSEGADIGQRKSEPKLIFVAHLRQRKPPVLHIHTAAVPIVSQLCRPVLHAIEKRIETQIDGAAESTLIWATIPDDRTILIELDIFRSLSG